MSQHKLISGTFSVQTSYRGEKGEQGEQGAPGNDAVTYDFTFVTYTISYDSKAKQIRGKVRLGINKHKGSTVTPYSSTTPKISLDGGGTWSDMDVVPATPHFETDYGSGTSRSTAPASLNFKVVIDGATYTASMPVSIKGDLGPMCYIAGECKDGVEYKSSDQQTVAVEVQAADGTETEIWYLDAATNKVTVAGQTVYLTPSNQSGYGHEVWKQGLNNFNLIRTKYLFADFAKLGESVVSGDWQFSANGYMDGVAYNNGATYSNTGIAAYMFFDPLSQNEGARQMTKSGSYYTFSPGYRIVRVYGTAGATVYFFQNNERKDVYVDGAWRSSATIRSGGGVDFAVSVDQENNNLCDIRISGGTVSSVWCVSFIPNYSVDLLTGKTYQNDAYVRGQIVATSGQITGDMTVVGNLFVGTYGAGNKSIRLIPDEVINNVHYGAGISGFNGTTRTFRLGFNDDSKGMLSLGSSILTDGHISLTGDDGSVDLSAGSTLHLSKYAGTVHYAMEMKIFEPIGTNDIISVLSSHKTENSVQYSSWPTTAQKGQLKKGDVYIDPTSGVMFVKV